MSNPDPWDLPGGQTFSVLPDGRRVGEEPESELEKGLSSSGGSLVDELNHCSAYMAAISNHESNDLSEASNRKAIRFSGMARGYAEASRIAAEHEARWLADKARLDWLDNSKAGTLREFYGGGYFVWSDGTIASGCANNGKSIREAIDTAMKEDNEHEY